MTTILRSIQREGTAAEPVELTVRRDCIGTDWEIVARIMSGFGLSGAPAATHRRAFENSYGVTMLYDGETLIGFGRILSDGVSQAAIYNIALDERYHGLGLGGEIIRDLLAQAEGCNTILYTHPDKVSFYTHLGFRRMKTGLAMYQNVEKLEEMGFIE